MSDGEPRKPARYGCTVEWVQRDGHRTGVGVSDCESVEEAQRLAYAAAAESGWTPRRWWQWWRWREVR
jgi:hypothetical protein